MKEKIVDFTIFDNNETIDDYLIAIGCELSKKLRSEYKFRLVTSSRNEKGEYTIIRFHFYKEEE